MGPVMMKAKNEDSKKKAMITVEVKKEIIEKYERGIRVADTCTCTMYMNK
jgi:hypothetical protein